MNYDHDDMRNSTPNLGGPDAHIATQAGDIAAVSTETRMAQAPTPAERLYGDIAPGLADLSDRVLFGEVWERPGLSKRDRSLVTVAALVAGYRHNELPGHVRRALENGVGREELVELVLHLAFYAGWPTANSAVPVLRKDFAELGE
jgi:4-carboxymuconolactone decarboxylase